MEETTKDKVALGLKMFYDMAIEQIKLTAMLNRALADKKTTNAISKKVKAKYDSIQSEIHNINPDFTEESKKYVDVKQEILDSLTEYESVLTEYSEYYDEKIEKLIEKKLMLEGHLVGKIFLRQDFKNKKESEEKVKEKGNLKQYLSDSFSKIFNKFKGGKSQEKVDVQTISKMQDNLDIGIEEDKKIEILDEKSRENEAYIFNIKEKIDKINQEIQKVNEEKIEAIENAMENKSEWLMVTNVKKPKLMTRFKRFFANKFNPSKVVLSNVITPFKRTIEDFKSRELEVLKGVK